MRRTLNELLTDARARIERLTPTEAQEAVERGALIVDIRSDLDREAGVVPGSIHIPRTVLEWRVDPDGPWRNLHLGGVGQRLVVLCDHGYSSSLAAATLADLGYAASDVIGGFDAWRDARLPIVAPSFRRGPDELPGMGPPEPACNRPDAVRDRASLS